MLFPIQDQFLDSFWNCKIWIKRKESPVRKQENTFSSKRQTYGVYIYVYPVELKFAKAKAYELRI